MNDEERYIALGWRIIECKILYYKNYKLLRKLRRVSDEEYDAMEKQYLALCLQLDLPNTVVHKEYPGFKEIDYTQAMMEPDFKRPSVMSAYNRLCKQAKEM